MCTYTLKWACEPTFHAGAMTLWHLPSGDLTGTGGFSQRVLRAPRTDTAVNIW